MRLPGSAQVLEARGRRALALVQQGLSLNGAARRLGCAASSVMHWMRAHRGYGEAGLKVRPAPGRPRRLTTRQEPACCASCSAGPRRTATARTSRPPGASPS
jgi:transposase